MLTLAIALCLMFAVVGAATHWAERAQRRRSLGEDGHARHH
jgi:hypothetical protein